MPYILAGFFLIGCVIFAVHAYNQRSIDLTEEQRQKHLLALEQKIHYTQLRKDRAIREGNARLVNSMTAAEQALTAEYFQLANTQDTEVSEIA